MAAEVQMEPEQETPETPAKKAKKSGGPAPIRAGVRPLERYLCWAALGLAGLMALLFLLDFVASFPFGGASGALDIFMVLACGLIVYVCIDTLRELR